MNSESAHGYRPCIIIPGIGQSRVIETDENGEKIRNLWPFDPDIDALVKSVAPSAARMMLLRRDCGFTAALDKAVRVMLEPLSCTPDSMRKVRAEVVGYYRPVGECTAGEKRYIYKMVPLNALADIIGEENLYFFAYDIFGRADENARLLREFIAMVKEQRQCEKVDLIPVSMGATVAEMYFELYGADQEVKRVIGVVPAYDGSDIAADLVAGDINTEDCDALLEMLLSRREAEKISKLMHMMPKKVADGAVRALVRAACESVVVNSSAMWGIIPSERYPALRDKYLGDSAHDSMRAVTDRHWRVRRNIKELVRREQERSVEFYNICGCGKRLAPIAASDSLTSDTIVPTYSASMGAQCAPPGRTLSPGRGEPVDFISPRSDINAASAAVPDRTWFYYNMEHEQAAENKNLLDLVAKIASSDEPIDVFTMPEHPQFADYNKTIHIKNRRKTMKKMKSTVALVLALIMAFSAFTCASAAPASASSDAAIAKAVDTLADAENEGGTHADCRNGDCGHAPVVVVPGINHSPTYLYDENDEPVLNKDGKRIGGTLLILDTDNLVTVILKKLAWPLIKMLATQTDSGFPKAVYETVCDLFSIQKCDNEGNPINNLKTEKYGSLADMDKDTRDWAYRMIPMQKLTNIIGEDHVYFFTFNLVGSPMDSAANLNEYIQQVKKATGHDKVNLLNVSLGGTIFTAYLDAYGYKDINQVVNAVAATDGSEIIADFLTRGEAGFRIDDEFLYHEYIPRIIAEGSDTASLGYLLNLVIRIIPRQVFRDTLTAAMDGLSETLLVNCPQFWALVPSDRYDALCEKYLTDKDHAVLKAKTDRYHQAQLNLRKNVLAAHAAGVKIDSIAGANLAFGDIEYSYFSIIKSALDTNSDGIIQLSSTTMGATGAAPGQKLPDSYKPAKRGYMSVDGSIDASTAVLPDNTWIFIGQHHEAGNNDVVLTLACALFTDSKLKDVHSKPDVWPQYNGTCRTKEIRRWLLPDAKAYRAKIDEMPAEERPSAEQIAELDAAIAQGEDALNMTIADPAKADAAKERLTNILVELGQREPAKETSEAAYALEKVCCVLSLIALKTIGSQGYSDVARVVIKFLIKFIASVI